MRRLLIAFIIMTPAFFGNAAPRDVNGDGAVHVIVPLVSASPNVVSGAYGSLWSFELWFHNGARDLALIQGGFCTPDGICSIRYRVGKTELLADYYSLSGEGASFFFSAADAPKIQLSARVLELSRNAQPNGVEIPVVPEDQWFTKPAMLVAVPQNIDSRVALRIYAPWMTEGSSVRVDLENLDGGVIASTRIDMTRGELPRPGYAAINDLLVAFPQLAARERFNIRVTPLTENMHFWTFATVTHRDTQHVLMVTPQLGE